MLPETLCRVALTADELDKFSGRHLTIQRQADQSYYFSHSCPQLHDDGCAIDFNGQPKDCSSFQCRTLKQLLNRKIDATTAHQRVERVNQQIDMVLEGLQPGKPEKTDLQDLIRSWLQEKRIGKLRKQIYFFICSPIPQVRPVIATVFIIN